jgi:hypothetical protein
MKFSFRLGDQIESLDSLAQEVVKQVVTDPGADRGPRAGSPRGVVAATGSKHSTVS